MSYQARVKGVDPSPTRYRRDRGTTAEASIWCWLTLPTFTTPIANATAVCRRNVRRERRSCGSAACWGWTTMSDRLDEMEKAYHEEGFETIRKGDGALLMGKDAPVVHIIGQSKGGGWREKRVGKDAIVWVKPIDPQIQKMMPTATRTWADRTLLERIVDSFRWWRR